MPKLTNKAVLAALDAAANRTGIPALATGEARRRHLRWLPVVALTLATGGWILGLAQTGLVQLGYGAISLGFAIAVFLPIFGPIKPWGGPKLVDEFDRQVRQRAFLFAYATISFTALLGIWLLVGLALLGGWDRIGLVLQLCSFAHYLLVLYFAVPTLHASWATRPIADD